jgi:hypothetical protein
MGIMEVELRRSGRREDDVRVAGREADEVMEARKKVGWIELFESNSAAL